MTNLNDIKNENELNQRLHTVLLTVIQNGENLGQEIVRSRVVGEIKEVFKEFGYSKNCGEYVFPLKRCETCHVRRHCFSIKTKHCPNELSDIKKRVV